VADMAAEGYAEHAGYAVLSAVAWITAVGEAKGGEVPSTGGKTADGLTWADVDGLEWAEVDGLVWFLIGPISSSHIWTPAARSRVWTPDARGKIWIPAHRGTT